MDKIEEAIDKVGDSIFDRIFREEYRIIADREGPNSKIYYRLQTRGRFLFFSGEWANLETGFAEEGLKKCKDMLQHLLQDNEDRKEWYREKQVWPPTHGDNPGP